MKKSTMAIIFLILLPISQGAIIEISMLEIIDRYAPDIIGEIIISNRGRSSQDCMIYYWITDNSTGNFSNALDSGRKSKLIYSNKPYITQRTLNVPDTGIYWYKVRVQCDSEESEDSERVIALSNEIKRSNLVEKILEAVKGLITSRLNLVKGLFEKRPNLIYLTGFVLIVGGMCIWFIIIMAKRKKKKVKTLRRCILNVN